MDYQSPGAEMFGGISPLERWVLLVLIAVLAAAALLLAINGRLDEMNDDDARGPASPMGLFANDRTV
jgi:hypothetical protein